MFQYAHIGGMNISCCCTTMKLLPLSTVNTLSGGYPRMINKVCDKALLYAAQQHNNLIDDHMVMYVNDNENLVIKAESTD